MVNIDQFYFLFRSLSRTIVDFVNHSHPEKAEESIILMEQLPIRIVAVDRNTMYTAARIKAACRIAPGDCFAAAEAIKTNCPVVTGDKEFKKLGKSLNVEWL